MESGRIDLWLKLVCLFKHRSDSTEACAGGHVKINGKRAKPASSVKAGDVIELTEPRYRKVVVEAIPQHNVSKEVARTMYRDETPVEEREEVAQVITRDRGMGRPTKKERREIDKWRR